VKLVHARSRRTKIFRMLANRGPAPAQGDLHEINRTARWVSLASRFCGRKKSAIDEAHEWPEGSNQPNFIEHVSPEVPEFKNSIPALEPIRCLSKIGFHEGERGAQVWPLDAPSNPPSVTNA